MSMSTEVKFAPVQLGFSTRSGIVTFIDVSEGAAFLEFFFNGFIMISFYGKIYFDDYLATGLTKHHTCFAWLDIRDKITRSINKCSSHEYSLL